MKPARFEYEKPSSLDACMCCLGDESGFAKALAGGQSLGPMMNLRLAQPDQLVDLDALKQLREVTLTGDGLFVGAMTTHSSIEDGLVPDVTLGMMQHVAGGIGYRGVRNRGTIGGSVVHADPAGDWPAALLALSASVHVSGPAGEARIELEAFQLGAFTVALEPAQVVLGVLVPCLSAQARWGYYKLSPKPGDFADTIGAFVLDPRREFCRLVLGANGDKPMLLAVAFSTAEAWLTEPLNRSQAREMIERLALRLDEDKLDLHAVALSRAVAMASGR